MNVAILAERNVERFGEYEALIFEDRAFTNVEQLEGAHRFGNALVDLGLEPGDRVAVMVPNCPEVYQAYGGVTAAGGVVVPIVFLLAGPEVNHIVVDCEPRILVTGAEFLPLARGAIEGVPRPPQLVAIGGPTSQAVLGWEDLTSKASPALTPIERDDDDLAVIMYTGGTTGRPKGVMITHGNLLWMAEALAQETAVGPEDVGLMALPVSHLFGMIAGLTGQVLGTRGVLLKWFAPEDVLQAIERHSVTSIPMVPTMALLLMQHPDTGRYDTSSLKRVVLSAAPVPLELKTGFAERFGCEVIEGYGQTEASPAIAIEREGQEKRPGSCGKAMPGVEIAIMDDGGRGLPSGEVGEICARSPGIMKGYFNLADQTAEALAGGWLHTGDMGWMDADGYLYVTDRKKDLIIRGGFNVYPRDVEELLFEHPGVAEAAVVGRPEVVMGEEVVAFVVRAPGADVTDEELLAFCAGRLAKYKRPKEVRFVGFLPKSPIGKVLKKDLRALLDQSDRAAAR